MIPQGFIQDLLARADIVEVVGRHVTLKKAGINFKGLCPFHGEKSPSFIVSPSRQTYHCFGCGAHGNAVGFLMEHGGLGFVESVRELADNMGLQVPDDDTTAEERERAAKAREQRLSLTDVLAKAMGHYREQLKRSDRAIAYLKKRGLTGTIAARFGLGYAPPGSHALASAYARYDDPQLVEAGLVIHKHETGEEERRYDRFRDRIMFPIRNPKGEVIGFGGRILDSGEPKYLNSPETPVFVKGRELYGLYEARQAIRERGHVLVTEGYMDVVALAQLGVPHAVATLGTACTPDHIGKLMRFTDAVVFSFDGDAAGRRAASRALEAVLPHATDTRSFRFLFLPPEHDPDSYIRAEGREAFERCIAEAIPLSAQLMAVAASDCDLATPEGRSRMLAQARPLFEQLPDGLLQAQLLNELAQRGGLAPEVLAGHWQRAVPGGRPGPGGSPPTSRGQARQDASPDDWTQQAAPPDWVDDPSQPPGPPRRRSWGDGDGGKRRWKDRDGEASGNSGGPNRYGGKGNWRDRGGRPGESSGNYRRVPPRTATLLDRAAWLMVREAQLWLDLPPDEHERLVQQPAPYGEFFAALERLLHDQGVLPMATLLEDLGRVDGPDEDSSRALLIGRIRAFHEVGDDASAREELVAVLKSLHLQAVDEEITMLLESGDLSEAATERRNALMAQRAALKAPPPPDPATAKATSRG
ncbi:DNA primase [Leptothrix discophora]|uniref:DNA primase n=1 Tax=Leptothrix discophora TaxID=89 RepID=A0ABT9FYL3_LEPDI|nr:DNA primase [Leptothrix discophora]MDP4299231.1 DNA primase [Leptothrix discophora]